MSSAALDEWNRLRKENAAESDRTLEAAKRHARAMTGGAVFRDSSSLASVDGTAVLAAATQLGFCVGRARELNAERERLVQTRPD